MTRHRFFRFNLLFLLVLVGGLTSCRGDLSETIMAVPPTETAEEEDLTETMPAEDSEDLIQEEVQQGKDDLLANVISVDVNGEPNSYTFSVGISSPDTGCQQYTDWWEVISEGGELIYRRILLHSHVSEQPFTRSGGPVEISSDTEVIIRAHMNPGGYGGIVFKGTVGSGFEEVVLAADYAAGLENQEPLPTGCDF